MGLPIAADRLPAATRPGERSLGPDLARGAMLLAIALANSHYFLDAPRVLGGYPRDGGPLDRVTTWLISTTVDERAFPMFGLLFGYGVAQVVRRQAGRGRRGVRRLLWRRALALVGIGWCHAMLLYVGDILAAYGVLLLLGAWVVWWRDRWLLVVAGAAFALTSLPGEGLATTTTGPGLAELPPDPWTALAERAAYQPWIMLLGPIGFLCPFLVGLWAGRRRLLERPAEYRRVLVAVAGVGIPAAWLGAQPIALVLSGARSVPAERVLDVAAALHTGSGVLGGAGYAAALALLAGRISGRPAGPGPVARVLAATGQRSMTCYVAQSVVWSLVFTPFLLDLSRTLSVAAVALLATGTWLATVVPAVTLDRAGRRGPFEVLLRGATYGSRRRTQSASPRDPFEG